MDAANKALTSPLMDISIQGATRVLFNVTSGSDLTLTEIKSAADIIQRAVDPQANIIFGVVIVPSIGNEVQLTLIATGFITKEALATNREKEIARLLKRA